MSQVVCAWIPELCPIVVTKKRSAMIPMIIEVAKRCLEASDRRLLFRVLCEDQKSWRYDAFVEAICTGFVDLGSELSPAQMWQEIVVEVLLNPHVMRNMAAAAEVVGVLAPALGPDRMFDAVRIGWEDEVRTRASSVELEWSVFYGIAKGMKRLACSAATTTWKGWDQERLGALCAVVLEVAIFSVHMACDKLSHVLDDKALAEHGKTLDITFLHFMTTDVFPCLVRYGV